MTARHSRSLFAPLFIRDRDMWMLRGSLFMQLVGVAIVWTIVGNLMKEAGLHETAIGLLLGMGLGVQGVSGLFFGWLSDKTGRTVAITAVGTLLIGVGLLAYSQSSQPWHFALATGMTYTGLGSALSITPVLALSLIGEENQAQKYGWFRVFGSLGYIFALFVVNAVIDGYANVCLTAGILTLVGIVPLMLTHAKPNVHPERRGWGLLLRHRELLTFYAAVFVFHLGIPAVFQFLSIYAAHLGMAQWEIGWLLSTNGFIGLTTLPLIGRFADRFGHGRFMTYCFLALPLRILILTLAGNLNSPYMLYAAQPLHVLTWAGTEVCAYAYVCRHAGRDRGVAVAAYLLAISLGTLVGNVLTGYLADKLGYIDMQYVMAALSFVGFLIYLLACDKRA